ncbi:transposase (plasmid) [Enterobacter asburiae]
MADNSMTFSNTLMQLGGEDFLHELTEFMLNRIMEADVTQRINAEPHDRSDERETYRNGYRDRQYNTRLGTLDLRIPKLREGTYFPPFLEACRLLETALNAVIQEAWIHGVSTRKVDGLVQLMGMTGISRSQVSSICRGIDERVQAFLQTDDKSAHATWREVAGQLEKSNPAVTAVMDEAEADVLAYFGFPKAHRVKIHSTNTLARLNKEVKRRADVVGIFPNEESIMRLLGAVLTEQNEEWLLQNCHLPQHSMAEIDQPAETDVIYAPPLRA